MTQIRVGDKVQLITGGPEMVVNEINSQDERVTCVCVWFQDGYIDFAELSPYVLSINVPSADLGQG